MSSSKEAFQSNFKKSLSLIWTNPEEYINKEIKDMLDKLGLNISDIRIIDSTNIQWQDNGRVKGTVCAQFMEDVRIKVVNIKEGDFYIMQLLFSDGTYNREVASVPSKNVIVPGLKNSKGGPVTLFSQEWIFITSNLLFEQYCFNNKTTVKDATPEQKQMFKKIYKSLEKKVIESKLAEKNIAVYINYNVILQEKEKEEKDIHLMINRYIYGNSDNTLAIVSTSSGKNYSLDIMNKELLQEAGITRINEGKKIMATLQYTRTEDLMSTAVDNALMVQAAATAAITETVATETVAETEVIAAPFSTELPIIGNNGETIKFPFQAFSTHTTQVIITDNNYSRSKGCRGGGATRSAGGIKRNINDISRSNASTENNTDEDTIPNPDDVGITITTCSLGKDMYEMPVIKMNISSDSEIILQPGNFQVNVVLCCGRNPYIQDDEKNAKYFCDEFITNMLKARIHIMNELQKVQGSNNITALNKAVFNHYNSSELSAKEFLTNSVQDLFNPFNSTIPRSDDFDIEKFCQEQLNIKPIDSEMSDHTKASVSVDSDMLDHTKASVSVDSDMLDHTKASVSVDSEMSDHTNTHNFVTWKENDTKNYKVPMVNIGDKSLCSTAEIMINVKEHDGKDDEIGEPINKDDISVIDKGTFREVEYKVKLGFLIKVMIKSNYKLNFIPIYISDDGTTYPESNVDLKISETYELPYPLEKKAYQGPESWEIHMGSKIVLKLTFIIKQ
jgi:hypothetical protein